MKIFLTIVSLIVVSLLVLRFPAVLAAEDYHEKTVEHVSLYKDTKSKLAKLRETCSTEVCISQNSEYMSLVKKLLGAKLNAFSAYSFGISEEILLKEGESYSKDETVLVKFVLSNLESSLSFYKSYIENLNDLNDLRQNELMINSQLEGGLSSIRVLAGKPELQELKSLQLQLLEQRIALSAYAEDAKSVGNNVSLLQKHLADIGYYLDQTDLSIRVSEKLYADISQSTSQIHATRKFEYQMEQTVQHLKTAHSHLVAAYSVLERLYIYKPWEIHE